MYTLFQNAANTFQPTLPRDVVDNLADAAGFDLDGIDWMLFKRLWGIFVIDLTPGVPGGEAYVGYQPVIFGYEGYLITIPDWARKCPVFALRE